MSNLLGRIVKIRANDFVNHDTAAHIVLVDEMDGGILLELDVSLNVAGVLYEHAVALPRLEKDSVLDLLTDGVMRGAVTWLPLGKFDASQPFVLSWWRGGGAAVTDICLE